MISLLKQIPLFSTLKDEELDAIYELSYTKKCSKDAIILLENEEGDTLFIILGGKVKVTTFSESGKEVIFSILSEGDFFGDMSLMDGKPRSATVISIEESELRLIRRNDFIKLIEKHPRIALKLLEELTSRLRKADERIESLAIHDVTGRLAGILLELAEERGDKKDKSVLIKARPTHQELANMVGTTRETVTRVLKQLENKNYINMSGKDLLILDSEVFKKELYF
ncbi:Crp/Fnr family transcriptional regulator [Candidatus Latescibacterota bacterium]